MNTFKILTLLVLVSFALGNEINITRTDSGNKYYQIVMKDPTEDTSKKLRLDIAFSTEVEIPNIRAFYAVCGTHDVGGSLTDNNRHPGFMISMICTRSAGCTPSASSFNDGLGKGKYLNMRIVS